MFETRKMIIDGEKVTDTYINKLHYSESHGVFGSNTLPIVFEMVKFVQPTVCNYRKW